MTIVLDGSAGITTPATSSGNVQATSINNGPLAGFRNAIINGNFDIWQRGTSFSGTVYGADRWLNTISGTTATQSRQGFALGQTDVPGEPTYFCRTVVSSVTGVNNLAFLTHKIEDVRTFAGQTVTLSFWAKADAVKNIAIELVQFFGSGGSPSAEVNTIGGTKVSIGTAWQKVTATATVPSISGKSLGTNLNNHLALNIWFDAGSNWNSRTDNLGQQSGTFDIAQVQLEAGPVATPFERRPIGTELALCQRYYQTGLMFIQGFANSSAMGVAAPIIVQMRSTPSVVLTLTASGGYSSGLTTQGVTDKSIGFNATFSASVGAFAFVGYTADAEL